MLLARKTMNNKNSEIKISQENSTQAGVERRNSKYNKVFVYGVTDNSKLPFYERWNDYLLDISPISDKEKNLVFNSLKLLVSSGMGFVRALEMIAKRHKNQRFARILYTISYDMNHGLSFSKSLKKYPQVFQQSEIKNLYAGELSGHIEDSLHNVVHQLDKDIKLSRQISSALMYPFTALFAVLLAVFVIFIFVIPKFQKMFDDIGSELPVSTQLLISLSENVRAYWVLWLISFVMIYLVFKAWKESEIGKIKYDGILLELPIFGYLIRDVQTLRITSQLGTLLLSHVPLQKSIHILGQIIPNAVMSSAIFEVERKLKAGEVLSDIIEGQELFDPVLAEVIRVGERTGKTGEVLKRLGNQYEIEMDNQFKNITSLIEPIVLVLVGGVVVFLAIAIMSPIFKIQEAFVA